MVEMEIGMFSLSSFRLSDWESIINAGNTSTGSSGIQYSWWTLFTLFVRRF